VHGFHSAAPMPFTPIASRAERGGSGAVRFPDEEHVEYGSAMQSVTVSQIAIEAYLNVRREVCTHADAACVVTRDA
jgi:hypothetical protein